MKCNCGCDCDHGCGCSCGSGVGKFVLGALVGGTVALLFTPKTGSENRKALKKKFDELTNYVKNLDVEEVKQELEDKIDDLKKDLEALDKETVVRLAKQQGEKISKKATELYEYATKKASPVVTEITEEIKDKTLDVAREVVEKLEDKEPKKETKSKPKKSTK